MNPPRRFCVLQAKEWEKQQRRLAALKKGGQSKGKAEETVSESVNPVDYSPV